MYKLTELNGVTTSKRDRWRRFSAKVRHAIMINDKRKPEGAKDHMKHKPYECDFGGIKDE